jgi:hypothetical protein
MELTQDTRNTKRLTLAEREQIVSLYRSGAAIEAIKAATGRAVPTIYSVLTREGIEPRRRQSKPALRTFCEVCGAPVRYVPPSRRTSDGIGRFCSQACMGTAKRLPESILNATELDCRRCGAVKPVSDFYPHAKTARGYQYWCKTCCLEVRKERAKTPVDPKIIRKWKMAEYGITPADYDQMFEAQHGRCAICGREGRPWAPKVSMKERKHHLVVDHDHATGRVRALLCWNCNCGLGHFREDPEILAAAIRYAAEHQVLSAA